MDMFLNGGATLSLSGYELVHINKKSNRNGRPVYHDYVFSYYDYLLNRGISLEQICKILFEQYIFSFNGREDNLRIDIGYSKNSYSRITKVFNYSEALDPDALCSVYLNKSINEQLEKCVTKIEIHKEKLYSFQKYVSNNILIPNIFAFLISAVEDTVIINLQRYIDTDMNGDEGVFNYLLINWIAKYKYNILLESINNYSNAMRLIGEEVPRRIEISPSGKIMIDSYYADSETVSISLIDGVVNTVYPFIGLTINDALRKKMAKAFSILRYDETPQILLLGKQFIINLWDATPLMFHYFIQYTKISLRGIKVIDFSSVKQDLSNLSAVIGEHIDYYNYDLINDGCWGFLNAVICGDIIVE